MALKYKAGDQVRIKSLDWYNKNIKNNGIIICGSESFTHPMSHFCDKVVTIVTIQDDCYRILEDDGDWYWTDEMIEGLMEEEVFIKANDIYNEEYSKGEYCHEQSFKWGFQEGYNYSHENDKLEISLKEGYQFVDENGNVINATKIVLEKKKKCYPKTFDECCKILGILNVDLCFNADYRSFDASKEQWKRLGLMNQFYQLLICRDAYWKIAGEEMGLGKPWEPDWNNISDKYCIYFVSGDIWSKECQTRQCPFAFPTPKMRDAFKENFDKDIEICKEFL